MLYLPEIFKILTGNLELIYCRLQSPLERDEKDKGKRKRGKTPKEHSRKDQKIGFIAKVSLVGRALAWGFWSRLVLQI